MIVSCFSTGEWLYVSPDNLTISPGDTPTLTVRLLQLLKMQVLEVKVYYRSPNGSERLLHTIPYIKIRDGVADYVVNMTSLNNGFIVVRARFAVNSVSHEVESAVKLTCKNCILLSAHTARLFPYTTLILMKSLKLINVK